MACAVGLAVASAPALADEPTGAAPAVLSKAPRLTKRVEAVPPATLAERGAVEVQVVLDVDDKGKVGTVAIGQSGGADFDEAALAAARQFEFQPGEAAGKPVPVQITYVFHFAMKPAPAATTPTTAPAPGTPASTDSPTPGQPSASTPAPPDAPDAATAGPTAVFEGEVLRKGERTPVADAVILLDGGEPTTTTDDNGRFSFEHLAPGPHKVRVRGAGVETYEVTETLNAGKRRTSTYYVIAKVRYQSTVKGARPIRETVEQTLDVSEIKRIPGTNGDVLKAVQNLPGVARSPFGGGLLVVWGSAPQDTRVFTNGANIPTLFHFGGLRATVNSEIVQNLSFTPGGYGADYGRGLGGVVEIETRAPRTDGYHGFVQVDTIDGSFNVEGPITKNLSFGITARRSWIDIFLPLVTTNAFQLSPQYTDYQLRLHWTPSKSDTVDLLGFGSDDTLDLAAKNPNPQLAASIHTHTFYHQLQARWVHRFSDGATFTLTPSTGYTSPFSLNAQFGSVAVSVATNACPYNLRAVYRKPLTPTVRFDAGLDFEGTRFGISESAPVGGGLYIDGKGQIFINGVAPWAGVLFSDESKRFTLNTQVRLEGFFTEGTSQFAKLPGQENVSFSSSYFRPEVRLQARYQLTPWMALKGAFGNYDQAPDARSLFGPAGNSQLAPEAGMHYVAGADFKPTPTLSISLEGFYKDLSSLVVPANAPGTPPFSNEGIGRVYGGEVLARQELWKNFFGWVSYTLSRADRKDHPGQDWHLFQYDQTHILTIIASYILPRGFQLGVRFRYVTGNPSTPVAGSYVNLDNGNHITYSGAPYSARLDAFNQLDVRLDKTWTYDRWKLSLYVDIQNIYNAQNPELYQYNYDGTQKAPVAGIPFFPAIGIRGDF